MIMTVSLIVLAIAWIINVILWANSKDYKKKYPETFKRYSIAFVAVPIVWVILFAILMFVVGLLLIPTAIVLWIFTTIF